MFQAVVDSVVPDSLNQIRPVQDLKSGRVQVLIKTVLTTFQICLNTFTCLLYIPRISVFSFKAAQSYNIAYHFVLK